jgi:hypothetical protein
MAILSKVKSAVKHPELIAPELNGIISYNLLNNETVPGGIDVFSQDWDNLILLDACRFDIFSEMCELQGKLRQRRSQGCTTPEFIKGNFANKKLYDTVYSSANPWYARLRQEIDSEIYRFELVDRDGPQGISSMPETVTKQAIQMSKQHPNKRLLVHYLQPHQPFIGERGKEITHSDSLPMTVSEQNLSRKVIESAYRENLELVLSSVQDLLPRLTGKTVISSDHGELLGERTRPIPVRAFGHPRGNHVPTLTRVPWLEMPEMSRKEIISDDSECTQMDPDHGAVEERLSNLGYI